MGLVTERPSGRRRYGARIAREYIITGDTTETDARESLLYQVPATLDDLPLLDNACEVEETDATDIFYGTAIWGVEGLSFQPPDPTGFEMSFSAQTESVHISHSYETIAKYPTGAGNAADFKQAINVQQDGTVEGVDILIPHMGFQVTYVFDEDAVDQAYVLQISALVGTVNDDTFAGFPAGELLLTRVSGQKRIEDGAWAITFEFAHSPNQTGLTIGDLTGIAKKGWEYLWVYYRWVSDVTHTLVKIPAYAYVERVYPNGDFADLVPP